MKKVFFLVFLLIIGLNKSYSQNAPVASNVSAATEKNTNASIHLVASDADFDNLTYSIVSNPSNGTASLSEDTVSYTPTTNFVGTDTFTFKANDGSLDSATKTVTITVIDGYLSTATQIGENIDGEAAGDRSGFRVSFNEDGSIIAIGSARNNNNTGHVRVYKYSSGSWLQLGSNIDGEAAGDTSGYSFSLSSDSVLSPTINSNSPPSYSLGSVN